MAKTIDNLGPTGQRVARRLAKVRRERDLTLDALSVKLHEIGRPISVTALSKIEQAQRRIDTDDLVALALALDVSPNLLLLADPADAGTHVSLVKPDDTTSEDAWAWAARDTPDNARVDGGTADLIIRVLDTLDNTPSACLQIGSNLIIKYIEKAGPVVMVRSMSPLERRALESNPEIQNQPQRALHRLALAVSQLQEIASVIDVSTGPGTQELVSL